MYQIWLKNSKWKLVFYRGPKSPPPKTQQYPMEDRFNKTFAEFNNANQDKIHLLFAAK